MKWTPLFFIIFTCFNSQAALVLFTDRTLYESVISGNRVLDDFNDITSASLDFIRGTRDRGDYIIKRHDPSFSAIALYSRLGVDRTGSFVMGYGVGSTQANFKLDFIINAFSFDIWGGFKDQNYEIIVGEQSAIIDVSGDYSFFGFLSDKSFDDFIIRDTDGEGNGYFDNFSVASVSEPQSFLLLSSAFFLLFFRSAAKRVALLLN